MSPIPTLVAIEGPLKGTVLPLEQAEVSVGRERSNTLALDDPAISRHHFTIHREGDRFTLKDCKSHNGTFVNDKCVRECVLKPGDCIKIGNSAFLFSPPPAPEPDSGAALDETLLPSPSTTRLSATGSLYLQPQFQPSANAPQVARDLKALIGISTAMQEAQTVESLAQRLLALLLDTIPASRAAVVIINPATAQLEAIFGNHRDPLTTTPVRVNPALVDRVAVERIAIVADTPAGDPNLSRSVIAAPLICAEEIHGVFYAETGDSRQAFEESHLQLVTAAGAIAGMSLANLRRLRALYVENQQLQAEVSVRHDMIGDSLPMLEVYRQIERVAPTDASVLIHGATGTGKELVARAIHRNSPRAEKPFVAINCAAVTETLLESELFGHERGAFTGALNLRKGRFEMAEGGTVFLDEIAEMALVLQAKLLRVLQEREFERVGGSRTIHVDIRVIAATNRDLKIEVQHGRFREDLYYRLKVVGIRVPSLRERQKDIVLLAGYFLRHYAERVGRKVAGFSDEALKWIRHYDWPGNVRELQHAIEQAVILGGGGTVEVHELRDAVIDGGEPAPASPAGGYHEAVEAARRQVILSALKQAGGVYTEAAKILGIHPVHLHRLARDLNLKSGWHEKDMTVASPPPI